MFVVAFKKKALSKSKKLTSREKKRIKEVIATIEVDPVPFKRYDIKKMEGHDDTFRIRDGKLRFVYTVDFLRRRITVHYIGPRSGAYK